jgi:hypothetical protein
MSKLYKVLGISKQAVFANNKLAIIHEQKLILLLKQAELLRDEHPGCGLEKMYYTLLPDFVGRDAFIELFMDLGFRVRRTKNYRRTTFSSDVYYENLINGLQILSFGDVWQTDITYIEVGDVFYYAVYIIDVYTRVIVGFNAAKSLHAQSNIIALQMAVNNYWYPKIHHSDRGSQYTSNDYIALLNENGTKISMGKCAQENAYAERINLTIKDEYLKYKTIETYKDLVKENTKAIKNYNEKRIHNNLNRKTPMQFLKQILNEKNTNSPLLIHDYENHPNNVNQKSKNTK